MAIKYECTKCGKRYVDWGAEKLGFICPCSETGKAGTVNRLVRLGASEEEGAAPSLKRAAAKKVIAPPVEEDLDEAVEFDGDDEEVVEDDDAVVVEADDSVVDADSDVVVDDVVDSEDDDEEASDEEVPADLDFENDKVSLEDSPIKDFDE